MRFQRIVFLIACCWSLAVAQEPLRPVDEANQRIAGVRSLNPSDKIAGGRPAPPGKYPFQVALITSRTPVGMELLGEFCGGSLIGPNFVLTAAHCVIKTRAKEVDVFIGSTVLPNGAPFADPAQHPLRRSLARISVHEQYDPKIRDNDIALLALMDPAPANFRPAIPAVTQVAATLAAVGQTVTVVGWGALQEGQGKSATLMEAEPTVQDSGQCASNYREASRQLPPTVLLVVTGNMFCAGRTEGGVDSCQGDSGGFLGAQDPQGHWVQLGIVSWGLGCARAGLFGVYTKVANYTPWIDAVKKLH